MQDLNLTEKQKLPQGTVGMRYQQRSNRVILSITLVNHHAAEGSFCFIVVAVFCFAVVHVAESSVFN